MDQRELSLFRKVKLKNSTVYKGEEVYAVTPMGVVIIQQSSLRYFYPWNLVEEFVYDYGDVAARKVIQGY